MSQRCGHVIDEFLSGTDPFDSRSNLRLDVSRTSDGIIHLRFIAVYGRSYTLEYRDAFNNSSGWQALQRVAATPFTQVVELTDQAAAAGQRFYRLAIP